MDRKKTLSKHIRNERCEHHSNLALLTTVMAMVSFVVLMSVYMGAHNPANLELALGAAKYCAVAFWIGAALFAYNGVKKKKKYLLEYIVGTLVMGFGLFFMYDRPALIGRLVQGTYLQANWANGIFRGLAVLLVVYSFVSIAWHVVLATPRKSNKK